MFTTAEERKKERRKKNMNVGTLQPFFPVQSFSFGTGNEVAPSGENRLPERTCKKNVSDREVMKLGSVEHHHLCMAVCAATINSLWPRWRLAPLPTTTSPSSSLPTLLYGILF